MDNLTERGGIFLVRFFNHKTDVQGCREDNSNCFVRVHTEFSALNPKSNPQKVALAPT